MDGTDSSLIARALAERVATGEAAPRIAGAVAATWRGTEEALSPVFGKAGVAALYKRSVFVAARTHDWLEVQPGPFSVLDAAVLESALACRTPAEAASAGGAVLIAFHDLLNHLVGPSLTERLLQAVWTHLSSGFPAQDIP